MIPEELRTQIAAESVCSLGSGIAWHTLLAQKSLSVGFLGGSVTQGYADHQVYDTAYPEMAAEALRQQGYTVQTAVCAEAGMDSMIGNLLADSCIIEQTPDLVFLEFAINETTLRHSIISFESLLRKLLTLPKPPTVCLFLLRNINDYSCDPFMQPMAEHYGLPYINLRRGLNSALEQHLLTWEDYADGESHPHPEGHRLLAACLTELLRRAQSQPDQPPIPLPAPWLDAPFTALRFLRPAEDCSAVQTDCAVIPRADAHFPTAWRITAPNGRWELHMKCRALVLFYETHHLDGYGSSRLLLDCVPPRDSVLRGASIYGWGNAMHRILWNTPEPSEHTVTLQPIDGQFFVLGIGYCP